MVDLVEVGVEVGNRPKFELNHRKIDISMVFGMMLGRP